MAHVLQASVFIPLVKYVCDKQNKKKKIEQSIYDWYKGSNICEGLFQSMMGFKVTSKDFMNEIWYAYA